MSQPTINDYRRRILAGEEIPFDELARAVEMFRSGRNSAVGVSILALQIAFRDRVVHLALLNDDQAVLKLLVLLFALARLAKCVQRDFFTLAALARSRITRSTCPGRGTVGAPSVVCASDSMFVSLNTASVKSAISVSSSPHARRGSSAAAYSLPPPSIDARTTASPMGTSRYDTWYILRKSAMSWRTYMPRRFGRNGKNVPSSMLARARSFLVRRSG